MEQKDIESIEYLEKRYPDVSLKEYMLYNNNSERGGWKALNYVIDKKLCTTYKEFFSIFGDEINMFRRVIFSSPIDAINSIKAAGGCAVLAHPGASFYSGDLEFITSSMIKMGIMGIECYHPENSPLVSQYCVELCNEKKLIITGGSDCHGEFVKTRGLLNPIVTLSKLNLNGINIL